MAKRPAPKRARRVQRFTPRRWLPFLALSALVAGAALVEPATAPLSTDELDGTLDATVIPAVTRADAVSTAWFCGGGTAAGPEGGGTAELTIVMANDDDLGADVDVTLFDTEGRSEATQVEVPAFGRARLRASDVLTGGWVAATVEVRGGRVAVEREVVGPEGFDVAPCSVAASERWFVPSGSTLRGATMLLSLFNPYPDATSVDISFATPQGAREPVALQAFTVPGRSVRIVDVGASADAEGVVAGSVTESSNIATTVQVRSGRVLVDRIQRYDGTGEPLPLPLDATDEGDDETEGEPDDGGGEDEVEASSDVPAGLVSTPAIGVRSPRWVFPSSRLAPGVRNRFAVFNPSDETAEVDLVLSHEQPDPDAFSDETPLEAGDPGHGEEGHTHVDGDEDIVDEGGLANPLIEPYQLTVRAGEQVEVDLGDVPGVIPGIDVVVEVRSLDGVPVVAERLSFFGEPNERTGAGAAAGSPVHASRWLVVQAGPSRTRGGTVQVANVGSAEVTVRAVQLSGGVREELGDPVDIPAGDRRSISLEDAGAAATLVIEATGPVVVSSSSTIIDGVGLAIEPAFPYPETLTPLAPD